MVRNLTLLTQCKNRLTDKAQEQVPNDKECDPTCTVQEQVPKGKECDVICTAQEQVPKGKESDLTGTAQVQAYWHSARTGTKG